MKERGMMPQLYRFILHPLTSKIFLCLLASVYLVYLVAFGRFLTTSMSAPSERIIEHPVETNPNIVLKLWTAANMRDATDTDILGLAPNLTQVNNNTNLGKAVQQKGHPSRDGNLSYPLS